MKFSFLSNMRRTHIKSIISSFTFSFLIINFSFSQLPPAAHKSIFEKEQVMKNPAFKMINSNLETERVESDSLFTRQFVQALKTPFSFQYNFDSLITISQLYAPDSSFKIFTWQLVMNEMETRQHGAIQMRTTDGSLKLFPLIDKSGIIENQSDTSGDNNGWLGAVYYKMIMKQRGDQKLYVLLGYDENDYRSTKKFVEILQFKDGKPWFGGKNFQVPDNNLKAKTTARYIMEFKKDASPRLTYDADLDMIVMEHLVSETNEPFKKYTLIGDGDYEGLKWQNGQWNYISKIFTEVTPEGNAPMPKPIRDAQGNLDETQLAGYEPEDGKPVAPKKTKPGKNKN